MLIKLIVSGLKGLLSRFKSLKLTRPEILSGRVVNLLLLRFKYFKLFNSQILGSKDSKVFSSKGINILTKLNADIIFFFIFIIYFCAFRIINIYKEFQEE